MRQFKEIQRFRQWWLWALLIVVMGIVPGSLLLAKWRGNAAQIGIGGVLASCVVPLSVILLFLVIKLKTRIDEDGIFYQFVPMQIKEKKVAWNDIERMEIRQYSALREYGGWGIRYTFGKGKALNVSGNIGLQIYLKGGKQLLLGTRRAEEMRQVLEDLGRM